MKHYIELKLPNPFKKDKSAEESKVVTQVDLVENEEKVKETMKTVGIAVGCLALGYLVGHRKGVLEQAAKIIVIK